MSILLSESCPICWREYSNTVIPFSGPCGHSICNECSEGVRICPLCRKRLANSSQRTPNYTLVSLLTKIAERSTPEMKDHSCQTEPSPQRPRQQRQSLPVVNNPPVPLKFKFTRDLQGSVKRFELCFK